MELKGKYKLQRRLGGGGMAEVFVGTAVGARGFEREVAIKRILPAFWSNPDFAQMFVSEAQVSATLSHQNVVSVLDFDTDEQGGLFLVMELVQGVDLHQLSDSGLLPTSVIIHVVAEALRGLGYAHNVKLGGAARGVVHRDVSPHNILLSWEGAVKISDFGLAKARSAGAASASEVLKGKPAYMSPEQANSQSIDGRSDLFSVGVILWELLAGRRLFLSDDLRATLASLFFKPIPLPSTFRASVPSDLERVAMKLLERDPAARYQTAEAAVTDLLACSGALGGRDELIAVLVERYPQIAPSRDHRVITLDGRGAAQPAHAVASYQAKAGRRSAPRWVALALVASGLGASLLVLANRTGDESRAAELGSAHEGLAKIADNAGSAPTTVLADDVRPGELPSDLEAVLTPHCKRLLVVQKRLSQCGNQEVYYRAQFAAAYRQTVASFEKMKSTLNAFDNGCESSLQYLEHQLVFCPLIPVMDQSDDNDAGAARPFDHVAPADLEVLRTHAPACHHLLAFLEARIKCADELDAVRDSFIGVSNSYAVTFNGIHSNQYWVNAVKPGDASDSICAEKERSYRDTGVVSCNPKEP